MSFISDPNYINLQTSVNHNHSVTVNPIILFSILDHSLRLRENETIAVGALLGNKSDNGEIEIRNSFPIPLKKVVDDYAIDKEYFKEMLLLHKRVNSKETVIGWYSTGNEITDLINEIHNTFPSEVEPVLLLVDTSLSDKKLGIKVFKRSYMGSENMFLELPCETKYFEAENSGLDIISSNRDNTDNETLKILSDMDNLEKSILQIQSMLDRVSKYVKEVVNGEREGNNVIGRYLLDTMSFIPNINATDFEKMFNKHLQDLLVVVYLANLTRSQLAIAEKLQNIV
jgi:translation initiation factor 3 subunit F